MSISVDIQKKIGNFTLDARFEGGDEIVGLLGESGGGKSMTLRCIAGIVTPDSGRIVLNGRTLFDSERGLCLSPRERGVGLLFQSYALFPQMTVAQNIAAGVRDKRLRAERVALYTGLLRLEGLERRYPRQLSGGQQQRVALARMMAGAPEILMLDEPFSALDGQLRQEIEPEFTAALAAFRGTVLYVSHDISEVYRYCAKTVMLSAGAVIESGETKALFARPQTRRGARLLCCKNISPVTRREDGALFAAAWGVSLPGQDCGFAGVYSDDVHLSASGGAGWHAAAVEHVGGRPRYTVLRLRPEGGGDVLCASCGLAEAETLLAGAPDGRIWFRIPPEKLLYLRG